MSNNRKFTVGFYKGNLLKVLWLNAKVTIKTYYWCKQNKFPTDMWYGIYFRNSDLKIAELGCLPVSRERSAIICELLEIYTKEFTTNEAFSTLATIEEMEK